MAFKQFKLDEQTIVTVYKRKASRNIRLSIASTGEIRVSVPIWAPYSAGLAFARSRRAWIEQQRRPAQVLMSGQPIGKAHHLTLRPMASIAQVTTRVSSTEVVVQHPQSYAPEHASVQQAAQKASIRALRSQATRLLPQRLAQLANTYDFTYHSVHIKQLKSRWGSCDQQGNIVLNLFLMQLPWPAIDYVLLHELTHTRVLSHSPEFWKVMETVLPDAKRLRKNLRDYQPILQALQA